VRLALMLLAMAPMLLGSLPIEQRTLTLSLCSGGEIEIPLDDDNGEQKRDCRQQGCHAGTCREKAKRLGSRAA